MADTPRNGSERLDSWKAIAAYLDRDERTVQRWERQLGLPVGRVPGGRGRSVFAFASEIDEWLRENQQAATAPAAPPPPEIPAAPEPIHTTPRVEKAWRIWTAVAVLLVAAGIGWFIARASATEPPIRVEFSPSAFVGRNGDGTEQWRYAFPSGEIGAPLDERPATPADILGGTNPLIIAAASHWARSTDGLIRGGQLFQLSPRGSLQRTFGFDDRLTFAGATYESPWGITDFRVNDGAADRRVAVAAHHFQWWPSMVTVLDGNLRRRGTFVHAGWMERVRWLSPDRLLIAGFSEAYDGGMVAILDTTAMNGQAPVPNESKFACTACGPDRPLRYIVMPRSEVNRVTGSRFNRALVQLSADRAVIRTVEVPFGEVDSADALYELTPTLDIISASFSERYWDVHRALEAEGKLDHTREQCPDRNGPRAIEVWTPAGGWRTQQIR